MLTEILFACTVRFKGKNSKLIGQKLKGSNGTLIRLGGFPIKIGTQISLLISYSLATFIA